MSVPNGPQIHEGIEIFHVVFIKNDLDPKGGGILVAKTKAVKLFLVVFVRKQVGTTIPTVFPMRGVGAFALFYSNECDEVTCWEGFIVVGLSENETKRTMLCIQL